MPEQRLQPVAKGPRLCMLEAPLLTETTWNLRVIGWLWPDGLVWAKAYTAGFSMRAPPTQRCEAAVCAACSKLLSVKLILL